MPASTSTSACSSTPSIGIRRSAEPVKHIEQGAAQRLGSVAVADHMRAGMAERRNSGELVEGINSTSTSDFDSMSSVGGSRRDKRLKSGVVAERMRATLAEEVGNLREPVKAINPISISRSAVTSASTSVVAEARREEPKPQAAAVAALMRAAIGGRIDQTEIEKAIKQIEAAKANLTKDDAAELAEWELASELAEHLRKTLEELDGLFADTKNFDFKTYAENVRAFKVAYIVLSERLRSIQLLFGAQRKVNADKLQSILRPFLLQLLAIVTLLLLFTKRLPDCFDFLNAIGEKAKKSLESAIESPPKQESLYLVDDTLEIVGKNFLNIERIMKQYGPGKRKGVAVEREGAQQTEVQGISANLVNTRGIETGEESVASVQNGLSDEVSSRPGAESITDDPYGQARNERMKVFLHDVPNGRGGTRNISPADQASAQAASTSTGQSKAEKRAVRGPAVVPLPPMSIASADYSAGSGDSQENIVRRELPSNRDKEELVTGPDSGYDTSADNFFGNANNQESIVRSESLLKEDNGALPAEQVEMFTPGDQMLHGELLAAQREKEQLMQRISFLEMDLSALNNHAQLEKGQFMQRIASLETDLITLNNNAQNEKEQSTQSILFLEANLAVTNTQLRRAEQTNKVLEQQTLNATENEQRFQTQLMSAQHEQELRAQRSAFFEANSETLKAQLNFAKSKRDKWKKTAQEKEKELNEANVRLASLEAKNTALEQRGWRAEASEQKQHSAIEALQEALQEKEKELNEANVRLASLEAKNTALEQRGRRAEASEQKQHSVIETLQQSLQKTEKKLRDTEVWLAFVEAEKKTLERQVVSATENEQRLHDELTLAKGKRKAQKESLKEKEKKLNEADVGLASAAAEKKALEQRIWSDATNEQKLHGELTLAQNKKEKWKEASKETEKKFNEAKALTAFLVAEKKELERKVTVLSEAYQEQQKVIEALKTQESSAKKKKPTWRKNLLSRFSGTNKSRKKESGVAKN